MKVMYVGLQPRHKERLYGTGVIFAGRGDVQEIEDEAIARKMLSRHPDQYADAEAYGRLNDDAGDAKDDSEAGTWGAGGTAGDGESATDASKIPEILQDGEYVPADKLTKDQLEIFAKANFNVDLDKRKSKPDLVEEVAALIRQQKEAE